LGGDDGVVVTEVELLAGVDAAFEVTRDGLVLWPDPHPGGSPLDEEYSRVTNPPKWRIIGARADAWLMALVDAGVAAVERDTTVHWKALPGTVISRTDRVVPHAAGALPLVVARSQIEDVPDAGVTLGVGDPAVCVTWVPYCGCDACDSGAQYELDQLDTHIRGVISGVFRRLSMGDREITVIGEGSWNASGLAPSSDITAILAQPTGWDEISGPSWLDE
jgi:hypothetical protein